MQFDPGLDLVWVRGPIRENGVNLRAGHHSIGCEFRCWVCHRSEVVDPHRDLPHVGPSDQSGAPARRAVTEGDHRMLIASRALLGVAPEAIGQALASRTGTES